MSYSAATFSPRIFFLISMVSGGYSVMSAGIWKSTNRSISQRGVQIA